MDKCLSCGEVFSKPLSAVLNVTNECNLRCKYCFVHHNPKRISLKVARAACEFLLEDAQEQPSLWFFGGEPMLEYERIIVPIVEEYYPRLKFGITTNGTLLTEDVIDFFKKYEVSILLSIDGVKEVQDEQRAKANGEGSFDEVLKNIPYLLLNYPDVTFRATMTKFSIPYMNKTYDFARHMGFKNITFVVNEEEDYNESDFMEMQWQYNQIALKILSGSPLWLSEIEKSKEYLRSASHHESIHRCGYGTTSVGISVDGELLPCQELSSFTSDLVIGNVFDGIDHDKHNKFLQRVADRKLPEPTNKEEMMVQNSICPKHHYYNNDYKISKGREYQVRAMYQMYVKLQKLCVHSNNPFYRRFFDR